MVRTGRPASRKNRSVSASAVSPVRKITRAAAAGTRRFEPLIERSARRPGHAQVQGDGVEHAVLARQRAPGAFGVGDHGGAHAQLLQEIAQHPRDVLLVVDDQHVAPTDPLRRRRRRGGSGHRRPVVRGKVDDERRAEAGTAFGGQAPSVTLHDAVADREPEPRPLPNRLRREERLEDAGQGVGRDPGSGVRDGHSHPSLVGVEANGDTPLRAARERLLGIEHEVQEHLLELGGVPAHERDGGGGLAHQRDAADAERILPEHQDPGDDVAQVHQSHLARARADEGLQLADDLCRLHGAGADLVHALQMFRIERPATQELGLTHDDGERIVDLVRHAAHELADRGELARLQEPFLRRLDLADTRGELGVEAGVLERQGRVVGEGLGQVDFLHRELPSHRVADLEHPDDAVAHDQWHRTDGADARLDDALPQVRRHVDPRLGQHVVRRDGPAQGDGPAIGARPRRHERPGGEARLKRAAGPDGDESAGRGFEAEERGGLSPEQTARCC